MKKKLGLVLVIAVVLAFTTGAVAKDVFEVIKAQIRPDFTVEVDGEVQVFKNADGERVYPILHDGTTYLPLRAIGELMGKTVYWYEEDKLIELKDEKKGPTVTDADVIVDGEKQPEKPEKPPKPEKEEKDYDETGYIGKEKAKEIALKKAGLKADEVKYIEVEFDKENGVFVYEVEFKKDGKEYKAEIKADDGKILRWDVEIDD